MYQIPINVWENEKKCNERIASKLAHSAQPGVGVFLVFVNYCGSTRYDQSKGF